MALCANPTARLWSTIFWIAALMASAPCAPCAWAAAAACAEVGAKLFGRLPNSTVPMTAMPIAAPTRCMVPMTPLAAPASVRSTVATMNCALGAMNRPLPRPATSSGAEQAQLVRSAAATSQQDRATAQIKPIETSAGADQQHGATETLRRAGCSATRR